VSSLSTTQQALVTAAIAEWVSDYDATIGGPLLADYTSTTAYADTYIAWGGTQASGVDPDVNGTYELACQNGVIIQGKTHYHTIFRDKTYDCAGTL